MKEKELRTIVPAESIETVIYLIRGQKVILDRNLAALYGVETRVLVQAVKRNKKRFPEDFMFRLTLDEASSSRSQFVILKRGMNLKYLPYAFTEQGVAMLSSVLRSDQAVYVNIEIMRAFIRLRQTLASHTELAKELNKIKEFALKNSHETTREFRRVWQVIEKLTKPSTQNEAKSRIGFDLSQ